MDLQGAHVLLTGASGGIGHALAQALADRGAQLTLTGRNAAVLEESAARVGGTSIVADLSDRNELDEFLARVDRSTCSSPMPDFPRPACLSDYSIDQIDRASDVNLRAPIVMAKVTERADGFTRCGHLVFMSSLSGKSASAHMALYNATKFGLRGSRSALRRRSDAHTGSGSQRSFPGRSGMRA